MHKLPAAKSNAEPSISTTPEGNSQLIFDGGWVISDPFHPGGESNLSQLESVSPPDVGFPPLLQSLPVLPTKNLQNVCSTDMNFCTALPRTKGPVSHPEHSPAGTPGYYPEGASGTVWTCVLPPSEGTILYFRSQIRRLPSSPHQVLASCPGFPADSEQHTAEPT